MKDLIILHGALGAKSQFDGLASLLQNSFNVHLMEFDGHGSLAGSGPFRIDLFAAQLEEFIAERNLSNPLVFGYSMGGYVALYLACKRIISFEKLLTLGTKFDWNPESALAESRQLNADKIEEKVPAFAAYLKSLHGDSNWRMVLEETAKMMLEMGNEPPLKPEMLVPISFPVICARGSADAMVSEAETSPYAQALSKGIYQEIEGWKHPIDRIPVPELADFLVQTYK